MAWFTSAPLSLASALILLAHSASAAVCNNNLVTKYPTPVAADGWSYRLIANNLGKPRSIMFDSTGALLVLNSGTGIERLTFEDFGGSCLAVKAKTTVVEKQGLNHGLALSPDGNKLFASTANDVIAWPYNATAGTVASEAAPAVLVTNMTNAGHTTRTIFMTSTGNLLVSRGSAGNADPLAQNLTTGHCQIRMFPTNGSSIDYASGGRLAGWGLRNSVGIAEHPRTGGIFSVENSVDNLARQGVDIHNDNPAEELNYHGNVTSLRGANHGYPVCYTLWGTSGVPNIPNLTTGDAFGVNGAEGEAVVGPITDAVCNAQFAHADLVFQAHTAPLDIKFDANGTNAFISFHGSWNRNTPVGYAVGRVAFNAVTGRPAAGRNSTTAVTNILSNKDLTLCPSRCFRPVGLAWDSKGRLWVASDSTGEIFVLYPGTENWDAVKSSGAAETGVGMWGLIAGALFVLVFGMSAH